MEVPTQEGVTPSSIRLYGKEERASDGSNAAVGLRKT
jgi:hypothetical protein